MLREQETLPLSPDQHRHIEELFSELSELPAAQRAQRLAAITDPQIRAEVESLLAFSNGDPEAAGGVFDQAVGQMIQAASEAGALPLPENAVGAGVRLGRYRIEKRLGQGGMGDVYEAVREDDFHKRVAVKIVRYGLDSDYARKRFAQERQVLAGLEHPNIARLIDGGTDNDQPYLVLEYVDGIPIDQYCQGRPLAEILHLFLKVCGAVEHAHRNLIIHRDLKPANILVTPDGEPKLLDFGIAKLIDATNPEITQMAFSSLTPMYASPEQIRNEAITTATDVYSLGVILFELLTGRKPYAITSANPLDLDRVICQTEPQRPGVSEDLDNIILMALRKDPARRYLSVRDLAEDLERSLTDRPVLARPDSVVYRASKFVRRHRLAIAAGVLVAVTLTGGIVVSQYQARRAEKRFGQVRKLANKFLFDFDNAIAPVAGTTKARELVVSTALEYLDNLAADAKGDLEIEAELAAAFEKLGDVQGSPSAPSLGRTADALASYYRSRALWTPVVAAHPKDAKALRSFAAVALKCGDIELRTNKKKEASQSYEAGAALAERGLAADPGNPDLAYLVGGAWYRRGERARVDEQPQLALTAYTKSLEQYRALLAANPSPRHGNAAAMAEGRVGHVLLEAGRPLEALPYLRNAVDARRKLLAANPNTAAFRRSLSIALTNLANVTGIPASTHINDQAGAEKMMREALAIQESLAAADAADQVIREDLLIARFLLAEIVVGKNPAEALRLCTAARAGLADNKAIASRTDLRAYLDQNVTFLEAKSLYGLGRYPAALETLQKMPAEDMSEVSAMRRDALRVEILAKLGRVDEARKIWQKALAGFETRKLPEVDFRGMREAARMYEVAAGIEPKGSCVYEKGERAIWVEWTKRSAAPQWYAQTRLAALDKACPALR